jgi:PAS domain S-box-containing protein
MNKTTILIVEDEAIVAADLAGKLGQLGYEVAGITGEGEEAVALAGRFRPQLVLMDIHLQGTLDGIQAADAIRRRHDVPVIYLTAHSDAATLARAKLTGPFGYILKPFEERELATQIELALYKHQTDRELRRQREWLRVTLTSIGDAVIATDAAGRISFVNPVAESLTGWKAEEALGRPLPAVFRIVNERTGQPLEEPVGRVLREGRAVALANHAALVTKDGHTVPVEDSAAPILDAAGQVIGAVLVFHDVTEKRRAEEALRESELQQSRQRHFLETLLNYAQACIAVMKGRELRYTLVNRAYQALHPEMAMIGRTYREVFPDAAVAGAEALLQTVIETGEPHADYGYHAPIPGKPDAAWDHQMVRLPLEEGEEPSVLVITWDATDHKRAQEALERSNRELEQFAYVASHDLQEPLRAVVGFLQLLQNQYGDQIDAKGQHFIERSVNAAHRMQTLIRELLALSRVSTKGAMFAPTDLNQVVKDVLDNLQSSIQEKNTEITCAELPNLTVDASQIRSLFQNLIMNAVRYNENPKPLIEIGCQEQDNDYHFFVKDNGIGISPKFYQRIFVVFQRLHTDREYPGTGLGLALCKKIVERHGGTIWVESEPQAGSTFHFTLAKKG